MMTLHLSPEERAAYKREKQRQRMERYRSNQAEKAWQREERYRQIEQRSAETHEENERLRSGFERNRQYIHELENRPPKERIVEVHIPPDPVTAADITSIGNIIKFLNDARDNPELLERAFEEIRPLDPRQKRP
jgi:hypothetical protein